MLGYVELPAFLRRSIPYSQGPFTTGCVDVLVGHNKDGTFMRIFYPTNEENAKLQPISRWSPWYLGANYHLGLASFIANFIIYNSCGWFTCLKYFYHQCILYLLSNILIPALWEAPILEGKRRVPVIIFSHGLGSHRSWHSSICNNMASYGFLVAAIEHRDESACATYTVNEEGHKNWIIMKETYLHTNEVQLRHIQLEIRAEECSRALDILTSLNEGFPMKNLLKSSFDLKSLKGKLDLSKPGMAGHSFGGGTVIEVLGKDKRFKYGVSLDPWMLPLVFQAKELAMNIKQPILFVLMENFQDIKNMAYLKLFQNERNSFYTIRDGAHQHLVDTGMIFANDFNFIQKRVKIYSPSFKPEVPLTIGNALSVKFILKCIDPGNKHVKDLDFFLERHEKFIVKGIYGTAESMVGWGACELSPDSCPPWESVMEPKSLEHI